MTHRAGVIGSPIAHSLSPAIFTAAFETMSLDWVYDRYEVGEDEAAAFMDELRAGRLEGVSVTMPDKAAVIPALDALSPVARDLGAVNCVVRHDDGTLTGHNTDGDGFVDALRAEALDLAGLRCVILGAGGAGRAIARAVGAAGAAEVTIVNRSAERAADAAALAGGVGRVGAPGDVAAADLVVNATSLGMGDDPRLPLDAELLAARHTVVDIVYHPADTPLLVAAAGRGARAVGGLGMLVHQAARAFELWTGRAAPIGAMRTAALAGLAARDAGARDAAS